MGVTLFRTVKRLFDELTKAHAACHSSPLATIDRNTLKGGISIPPGIDLGDIVRPGKKKRRVSVKSGAERSLNMTADMGVRSVLWALALIYIKKKGELERESQRGWEKTGLWP